MVSDSDRSSPEGPEFMHNKVFFTSYSFEILDSLFSRELENVKIKKVSDQLEIRPMLVDVQKSFANHQEYSIGTLSLGIYILDIYMDNYIISQNVEHQKLIALVCLLLAAKSEDLDELVPSIKDLLLIVDLKGDLGVDLRLRNELNPRDLEKAYKDFSGMYSKLEFIILKTMDFNVIRPTYVTFLEIFQNLAVSEADLDDLEVPATIGDLRVKASKMISQFTEVAMQDVDFANIRPSELAAAILAATRQLLTIKNYWNQELEKFTRYELDDLKMLVVILIELRNDLKLAGENSEVKEVFTKDSGYLTLSSTSETDDETTEKHARKKRKVLKTRTPITYEVL